MDLTPFEPFLDRLGRTGLGSWRETLAERTALRLGAQAHGDLPKWEQALARLPDLPSGRARLDGPVSESKAPGRSMPISGVL
jgi:tRNA (mo5U34)-methyltransferase